MLNCSLEDQKGKNSNKQEAKEGEHHFYYGKNKWDLWNKKPNIHHEQYPVTKRQLYWSEIVKKKKTAFSNAGLYEGFYNTV